MKSPALLCLSALSLFALPNKTHADVIVDDTFADGDRTSQSPALQSPPPSGGYSSVPWYTDEASKVSTSTSGMVLSTNSSGTNLWTWGYFTLYSGGNNNPITLANDGDSISLTFTYVYSVDAAGSNNCLRFGLFNGGTASRVVGDQSNDVAMNQTTLQGYGIQENAQNTSATGAVFRRQNNNGQTQNIFSSSGSPSVSASVGSTFSSFDAGTTQRTAQFIVTRTNSTTMTLSVDFDTNTAGGVTSVTDSTLNLTTFDSVGFFNSSTGATNTITIDNINVTFAPVPEPASVALLGFGLLGGVFAWKRRQIS